MRHGSKRYVATQLICATRRGEEERQRGERRSGSDAAEAERRKRATIATSAEKAPLPARRCTPLTMMTEGRGCHESQLHNLSSHTPMRMPSPRARTLRHDATSATARAAHSRHTKSPREGNFKIAACVYACSLQQQCVNAEAGSDSIRGRVGGIGGTASEREQWTSGRRTNFRDC